MHQERNLLLYCSFFFLYNDNFLFLLVREEEDYPPRSYACDYA